jgi:hypothetical protein
VARPASTQQVLGEARIETSAPVPPAASVAPEAGSHDAARVGAAIVLRDDFDVLVAVASVELVLDAEVREVDVVIEVRQVVFAGPFFDFRRVAIRSPVAVGSAAIVLLEPRLILALELLIEDHPMDVRALLAQASSSRR